MAIKPKMPELKFSPEGIVDLCPDLPEYHRNMLIDTFEVPMREEPYGYFLRVTVDPFDEQVAIERRFS